MSTHREKLEARAAFMRGTFHPTCPSCGSGDLFARRVGSKDHQGNTWKRYRCASCNEQFKATVENPS